MQTEVWQENGLAPANSEVLQMLTMVTEIVVNLSNRTALNGSQGNENVYGEMRLRLTLNRLTGHCRVAIKTDDCFTTVFDCCRNGRATVCRPGKWCSRVDQLYEKIQRRQRERLLSKNAPPVITSAEMTFPLTDSNSSSYVNFNPIDDWGANYC
ncbi:MAG: hypothetical protein Q4G02_03285 [bacterium]|nr:hypothetical protein [bacterium]